MLPTTIIDLEAVPLCMPLREPFTIATGAQVSADNVLVRVRLADGSLGLGEAAPFPAVSGETQERTLAALQEATPLVHGQDARAFGALSATLGRALSEQPAARAGLEMALLDAAARHYGQPLWVRFGGAAAEVRTDMTITAGDAAHAAAAARAIVARGIHTLKIKVGAFGAADDAERLHAIHEAAPGARLFLDANGGYDASSALDLLARARARDIPLLLFEQPVPREDHEGLLAVATRGGVPVWADESVRVPADVLRLRGGPVRGVNLKLMKSGIGDVLAMWSIARAAGLGVMMGAMVEGPLAVAFAAHLCAGLGGFELVDLDTHLFLASHPFRGGFTQEGDLLRLDSEAPGHGVSWHD